MTITTYDLLSLVFIIAGASTAVAAKKLTLAGGITGGAVALAVYLGNGWTGLGMLGTFFVLGTIASSVGKRTKKKMGFDDNYGGQRTAGQVIANGGVAGVCCLLAYIYQDTQLLFTTLAAASISSATADTLASELGTLYGKRFYNILTFRKDVRGENGVVSVEGTLIGIAGSCIIATIYCLSFSWEVSWIIVAAGTVGNITDSVLGATLERKGIIKNNAVNLLNTIAAALTAFLLLVL